MVYDPRTPGAKPMEIDQVNFRLNVEPAKGGETGWYTMEMDLDRKPVFATHFAGRVNIDTMVVDVQPVRVELKLGREQDHYLPPQIQSILKEHEVSGDLVVEASGSVHAERLAGVQPQGPGDADGRQLRGGGPSLPGGPASGPVDHGGPPRRLGEDRRGPPGRQT